MLGFSDGNYGVDYSAVFDGNYYVSKYVREERNGQ